METSSEKFDVWQFIRDGNRERVASFVSLENAVTVASHYAHCSAAILKVIERIIITDSGDCIVFEWVNGLGVIYPPPMAPSTDTIQ